MKVIMAARSPLSRNELRVALAVVPGDPTWYAAKVPTNASQLISLCGGNLIELDEEDGKIRFIHYSVVSHLLQTTKNPRTMLYHFTLPEAEIHSGAICVTFLNMPIFETAITMTRKIDGTRLAEEVIGTATQEQPLLSHLAQLFKKTDRRPSQSTEVDIGRLVSEIQATRMFKFDPHCFQDYAVSNWLLYSRAFHKEDPLCKQIWHLWMRLVCSKVQVASLPFQSPVEISWPALSWALEHRHKVLIDAIFEESTTEPTDGERISQGILELPISPPAGKYDRSSLGLIMVHLFQLAAHFLAPGSRIEGDHGLVDHAYGSKVPWLLYQSLQRLLSLGADPTTNHSQNGSNIIQLLLGTLGCISETTLDGRQLCDLLTRALACNNTQPLLRSAWVPCALQRVLEYDNPQIFAKFLSYVPKLHSEAKKTSLIGIAVARDNVEAVSALVKAWPEGSMGLGFASYINGRPAIQLALELQNKEMVALLARRDGLNHSNGRNEFSVPLLKIALERMSVEWVKLLLRLGADPNLGYQALIEEPLPHTSFRYHLQIAAERSQTLKFLTLVRYGADPFLPAFPTISSIILKRDNRVLMARLAEIDFFGPTKRSKSLAVGSRDGLPPLSALLESCKMLALDLDEDQTLRHFGVVESRDVDIEARGQELKLILLDLAKTTQLNRLNLQCREGNTALHYLTGGMDRFHHEALAVASCLLESEWACPGLILANKCGQTPLHRAIDNGSWNHWRRPYIDSALFLLSRLRTENFFKAWLTGSGNSILGFAISKGAPIDPLIRALLDARVDPNATLQGATPLEIAVNMPELYYASTVTTCLLSCSAEVPVKCSRRGLLDVVTTERRDWLQELLQKLRDDSATLKASDSWEWTMERVYKYESEDTNTPGVSGDEE